MKNLANLIWAATALSIISVFCLIAADHIDAPLVGSLQEGSSLLDVTDYYAFESSGNPDNYVFVCNVNGLLAPSATSDISFDENIMYEFNIDTDGDNVENLVIQVIFRDGNVIVYGPVAVQNPGRDSQIIWNSADKVKAKITKYGQPVEIGQSGGIKVFAGPRDDPFFMDFFRFVAIVNGVAKGAPDGTDPTAFNSPGEDAFQGTNVMSVVVEVPKSKIGGSSTTTFSSWLESKMSM